MTSSGQSKSLVVVGGWGVNAAMLEDVVADWPGEVHFVSLDDARLAGNESIKELARALIARYTQPSVWLGWSQGAQVVMAAADAPGTPVERAVTLAGFPRFVATDGWPTGMDPETFDVFRRKLAADPDRTWRRFQNLLIHGSPRDETRQAREELGHWADKGAVVTGSHLGRGLDWLAGEDQRELWQTMRLPALHVLAEADALVRPWNAVLPMPQSTETRVLSGMTHWPRGSKARDCGRLLLEFALAGEEV